MLSKLGFATFWGATSDLPRPEGVSNVVFVPNNLETHRPYTRMNEICMAFMRSFEPRFRSTRKGVTSRCTLEDGDWMFWFSPFNQTYKREHLAYLEHIMSPNCKVLRNLDRPHSWGLVKHGEHSGFVFVHDNLNFISKHFFCVNTFIRALWEYPEHVDNWVSLVNSGIDKDEALYFMWVLSNRVGDRYTYSFRTTHHGPLGDSVGLKAFLSGTPVEPGLHVFSKDGWETGIHTMWGTGDTHQSLLGLKKDGRFGGSSNKDLVTLIKERKR